MLELRGKYNTAKVFTDNVEETAKNQIIKLCNQEFAKDSKIRIMPDTHAGVGCTIGTTMTITNKIVPNLVGVDIGCGMYCVKLKEREIDFKKLDEVIRKYVPSGRDIREVEHKLSNNLKLKELRCANHIYYDKCMKSLGTLGGGNHFIEINKDKEGNLYLVIHSGSKYLGKQVAKYYQTLAYKRLTYEAKDKIISKLKAEGREQDILSELSKLPPLEIDEHLAYLEGNDLEDYLHDMKITQEYAMFNRMAIADEILNHMQLHEVESFSTIHNYIDVENRILRKGAISANKSEKVIIPINMKDGSIIAIGKGNEDWNYSAPHGAGRLFSRGKAKNKISLEDFKNVMSGVWTTSVCESTIDESPMAYKPIQQIIDNIQDTVDIVEIIKPVYNFKAN